MKRAIIFSLLLLLVGCSDDGFSEDDRRDFIAGCTDGGGTEALCECMVDELQDRLTADEFKELEGQDPEELQTDPRFVSAVQSCVESTTP